MARNAVGVSQPSAGVQHLLVVQKRRDAMRFAVRWNVNRSLNVLFYFHARGM
jgi:hypothetical protein